MHAQKLTFFLPHTKNISQKIRQRQFCTIAGFHNDEVGCPYFQVFATNLPFGLLNGETWWCKKWRKNHDANANHAIASPYAGVIDNFCISRVYPQKRDFLPAFQAKKVAISVHAWEKTIYYYLSFAIRKLCVQLFTISNWKIIFTLKSHWVTLLVRKILSKLTWHSSLLQIKSYFQRAAAAGTALFYNDKIIGVRVPGYTLARGYAYQFVRLTHPLVSHFINTFYGINPGFAPWSNQKRQQRTPTRKNGLD